LGNLFSARRGQVNLTLAEDLWPQVRYRLSSIQSEDGTLQEDGTWLSHQGSLAVPIVGKKVTPGVQIRQTRRALRVAGTDSLAMPSRAYIQVTPGVSWHTPIGEITSSMDVRTDERAIEGVLQRVSHAVTWDVGFDVRPSRIFRTEGRLGIRHRSVEGLQPKKTNQSAAIRWSGRLYPWQRALQVQWFYEALSERTPTLQEIYIRTGPELGEYVWIDANGNGVIELDEFLPETTQDEGNYVRALIPSDSLQSVTGLQTRFSVHIDPSPLWRDATARWQRMLRHLSLRTSVSVQEKSRNPMLSQVYLLRLGTFRQPLHTLKGLLSFQQQLSLFRSTAQYGLDFSYRHVRGMNALSAGTETRATDEYLAEGQIRIGERWGAALAISNGSRAMTSESFASRNYEIDAFRVAPELTFNMTSSLQATLTTSHGRKTSGQAQASLWKAPLDIRYSRARKFNISGRMEIAAVALRGDTGPEGLARFELTDGRGAGTSFIWLLSSWVQLSSVLRATLTYNGRHPEDAPTIRTVRMQLSAVF